MFACQVPGADAHVYALSRASQIAPDFQQLYSYPEQYVASTLPTYFVSEL
jgi:hypothetical protein